MNRYFLSAPNWTEGRLILRGDEAKHCAQVMREGVGASIAIFDGEGRSAICEILQSARNEVVASILTQKVLGDPVREIVLLQAIPKGKNMEWIIQKSVELGVNRIIPVVTDRTVVSFSSDKDAEKKREKWQRIALEACKQCGQDFLVKIELPRRFKDVMDTGQLGQSTFGITGALTDSTRPLRDVLDELPKTGIIVAAIGPEGDFSEEEYERMFSAGFHAASFGSLVLRVETATFLVLSALAIS